MSDELKECREAFEKWAIDEYGYDPSFHFKRSKLCNDKYYHVAVQGDWEIWQAAWNTRHPQQTQRSRIMSEKLLPCPFCDGEAIKTTDMGREAVACANCDISIRSIQVTSGYDWCVEQWNTRPTQQPTAGAYVAKAEIEKLLHTFVELGFISLLRSEEFLDELPTTTILEGEAMSAMDVVKELRRWNDTRVRGRSSMTYQLDRIEAQIKGDTQ